MAFGASFDCIMEPTQMVEVSSPVTGLLDKVHVARGDKVTKGQVLASLESRAEQAAADVARYKADMAGPSKTAETKIDFTKRKYVRRRDMHAENYLPAQERDDAEGEMKLAESELNVARENKQLARLEWQQQTYLLNLRSIRSPINGVVVDQLLYPGEVVEPSGQKKAILKLAQLDPLRVRVILPFALFGKITVGSQVSVSPEAPLSGQYTGHIKVVDRLVDAASGTFGVFLELPNPKLDVPAGIKCRADIPHGGEVSKPAAPLPLPSPKSR